MWLSAHFCPADTEFAKEGSPSSRWTIYILQECALNIWTWKTTNSCPKLLLVQQPCSQSYSKRWNKFRGDGSFLFLVREVPETGVDIKKKLSENLVRTWYPFSVQRPGPCSSWLPLLTTVWLINTPTLADRTRAKLKTQFTHQIQFPKMFLSFYVGIVMMMCAQVSIISIKIFDYTKRDRKMTSYSSFDSRAPPSHHYCTASLSNDIKSWCHQNKMTALVLAVAIFI